MLKDGKLAKLFSGFRGGRVKESKPLPVCDEALHGEREAFEFKSGGEYG